MDLATCPDPSGPGRRIITDYDLVVYGLYYIILDVGGLLLGVKATVMAAPAERPSTRLKRQERALSPSYGR